MATPAQDHFHRTNWTDFIRQYSTLGSASHADKLRRYAKLEKMAENASDPRRAAYYQSWADRV